MSKGRFSLRAAPGSALAAEQEPAAERAIVDTAALQRVVQHVSTHNRMVQCDEMWAQHERGSTTDNADRTLGPPHSEGRPRHTTASLIEARRMEEERRVALKAAAAAGAAGSSSAFAAAADVAPGGQLERERRAADKAARKKRKHEKRQKRKEKEERRGKRAKEQKREKRARGGEKRKRDGDASAERTVSRRKLADGAACALDRTTDRAGARDSSDDSSSSSS